MNIGYFGWMPSRVLVHGTRLVRIGLVFFVPLILVGCAASSSIVDVDKATEGREDVSDLFIVDCLLPGQVRVLGNRTFLSPRRPTRTTAADCRIRGGEYVAYDRANLKSALKVWLAAAEGGDADAQNNVGEIFERGLGDEPNYEAALIWYEKAAMQGHSAALLNLGTLYEQGHGVQKDRLKALNYYRQSWGLEEDDLIYQSAANREINALRERLQNEIDERDTQIRLLEKQAQVIEQQTSRTSEAQTELDQLRKWVDGLKTQQFAGEQQLTRLREPSADAEPDGDFGSNEGIRIASKDFGRYYALVIGNQNYERMEDLASPISDVTRIAQVLEQKYGFTVQLVQDANDVTVLEAMNNLNAVVGPEDNLLIYYAGHGSRRGSGEFETGFWLPVNADRPPVDTYWVPTEQITSHMGTFKAKRVLIVADSCYSGILADDPGMRMILSGDQRVFLSDGFVDRRFPKKSRLLVSSGGDRPVLDTSGNGNSVFANAFIEELESNNGLLTTPALFLKVRDRVSEAAARQDFDQEPEIKAIKRAGHEVGDFFFIPKTG